MDKRDIKAARASLKRIEALKGKIADLRDDLRREISDLEDIGNSLDGADEQMDGGLDLLKDGLDEMSTLV